jgi:hypothetical protein
LAFTFPDANWSPTTTYASGAKVNYRGLNYTSLQNANIGYPPATSTSWWAVETDWLVGTTYALGAKVTYLGYAYVSLVASNVGHTPSTTGTYWERLTVKSIWSPPATTYDRLKFSSTVVAVRRRSGGKDMMSEPGSPALQGHIGTIFYRLFPSTPTSAPGPSSVWIGRTVFRVYKPSFFFGLGQRANKPPVMHNSGE